MRPAASHRPDVACRRLEGLLEYGHVELGVVGQDGNDASAVDLGCLQELIGPGADDHTVAHELAGPRDGRSEVYGAEDVQPWRRGERLDEDGDVLHPALAAWTEVDRLRTPTLEQAARRLHDGLVQLGVARRTGMVFREDQDLAPEVPLRSLYHCGDGHRRLLG